jgi:heat shock protein HslJ
LTRAAAALLAALAAAGCASAPVETAIPEGGWLLPGTSWTLVELDGAPYPARLTATLTADGRVVGEGPCNSFEAPYTGRWPDVAFTVVSTERACADLAAETAAFETLGSVTRAERDGADILLLAPDGGAMRLRRV